MFEFVTEHGRSQTVAVGGFKCPECLPSDDLKIEILGISMQTVRGVPVWGEKGKCILKLEPAVEPLTERPLQNPCIQSEKSPGGLRQNKVRTAKWAYYTALF